MGSFFFIILFVPSLFAQIPRTISYQGVLTDNAGNPKPDGDYTITFSFYDSDAGEVAVWNEVKTIKVSKGLFSTSLGDQSAFSDSVKFDKQYWLGIKINSDPELSPRIILNSSAYSFSSINSDTAKNIIDGKVVKSLNNLKDDVLLEGSGGTTINASGNTITISSSGTGGTGIQGVQNTNNTLDVIDPNGPTATVNLKVPLTLTQSTTNPTFLSRNTGTNGGPGIQGISPSGAGVIGESSIWVGTYGETSTWYGVWGKATGTNGKGVFGESATSYGVWGKSPNSAGVVGESNSAEGVYGQTQTWFGVHGKATGENGKGVLGESVTSYGVWGLSQNGVGVVGESNIAEGVFGISKNTNGAGVKGYNEFGGYGVVGLATSGSAIAGFSNSSEGVYGESSTGAGVLGVNSGSVGALGYPSTSTQHSYGVYGHQGSGEFDYAGFFDGIVYVTQKIYATELVEHAGAAMRIDHPLDPANKYLIHSSVESSERTNLYSGNIITDASGSADVELPGYFETLNVDYRYQLTTIGQQAQSWIENEISNNHFTIKTDKPNVKVSWQVTGVRNDPYAKTHPFVVEQEKEEKDKGKYLRPELFGQQEEKGINYVKRPETKKQNNPNIPQVDLPNNPQ